MNICRNQMILAQDRYYSMNCHETQLNNNVLVVGTSGAGKTRSIVIPNLLQACGSYVVSDPKGNLYKKYGQYLRRKGYKVKCIDFVHPELSVGYNPLDYIRNTQDIIKMANMIVYQEKVNSKADPFWEQAAVMLFASVIAYLIERSEYDELVPSLPLVAYIISLAKKCSYGTTNLELLMGEHEKKNPNSWACQQFNKVNTAPEKTFDSILITAESKLRNIDSSEMEKMLEKNEIDLPSIGKQKTALFVVVSDTDRSMDNMANLVFTQAMNELCLYADDQCKDNELPVPVRFILDDFATNCQIQEFPRMISSFRSRNISTMLMIQAESQLEECYGKDGRTIICNCDTYIYLGGNDIETAKSVSMRCDLPLRKILYMPVGHNWIFRRGEEPCFSKNFDLESYLEKIAVPVNKEKTDDDKTADIIMIR